MYLRDERGTDRGYRLPALVIKEKKEAGEEFGHDECWVQLPATFWTNGWIDVLSGSAVAMLLVLLDEAAGKKPPRGLWHSPRQFQERFALSQDTRTNGLLELEAYRIVDMRRSPVSPGLFDFRRMRNVYDLHLEQLDVAPRAERPRKTVNVLGIDRLNDEQLAELLRILEPTSSST